MTLLSSSQLDDSFALIVVADSVQLIFNKCSDQSDVKLKLVEFLRGLLVAGKIQLAGLGWAEGGLTTDCNSS